jgi:hypothetical protein
MADIGIGRDRVAAFAPLHQRARDHRQRTDDRGLMRQPVFRTQSSDGGADTIDDRQATGHSEQVR